MRSRQTKTLALIPLAALLASVSAADDEEFKSLFDGKTPAGWKLNVGGDLPAANVQPDGLNPHDSGGYIVMYETPYQDFILDFDYKLSQGCNSGVFLRVGEAKDPVNTGLEVALDDSTGTGLHDPGAFYDLVPPKVNAQKATGDWNHMRIIAQGATIAVILNDQAVSLIDLSEFPEAGKRPDGSPHKFTNLKVADMIRPGFLGFQDHGQDRWFRDIKLQAFEPGAAKRPAARPGK